MDENIGEF